MIRMNPAHNTVNPPGQSVNPPSQYQYQPQALTQQIDKYLEDEKKKAIMAEWQPIETAPKNNPKMFVVIGIRVKFGNTVSGYISDPWCVWRRGDDGFSRWPHPFPPTHWMPLPDLPKETK
jgi:hypothetical protein